MTTQLITPNPDIPCRPGWCLEYVNNAFQVPERFDSATDAWYGSATQHRDRDFPSGVWHPVWYGIVQEPLGHVVLRAPDGSVYSTSDNSTVPHHHPDLADLERYYAKYGLTLVYRGWTEDVEGTPVIAPNPTINFAGTITPVQEDTMTPEQWTFVQTVLTSLSDNVSTKADVKDINALVIDQATRVKQNTQAQVEAVGRVTQQLIIDKAQPAVLVDQIVTAGLAKEVADLLAKRLAG